MNINFDLVHLSLIKYQTTHSKQIRPIDLIYFHTKNQLKKLTTINLGNLPHCECQTCRVTQEPRDWSGNPWAESTKAQYLENLHQLSMSWWFLHFWIDNTNTKCIGALIHPASTYALAGEKDSTSSENFVFAAMPESMNNQHRCTIRRSCV